MIVRRTFLAGACASACLAFDASSASAQQSLEFKVMAPAAPGGGWDATARSLQQAMIASGAAKSVQVLNVPGAGGTVGLAQFVNGSKGDGTQLIVSGFVMVGAIILNKSPVNLEMVTPIARITAEAQVIVVPTNSPIGTAKELADRVKADPARVIWAGGSAGGVDHVTAALFASAAGTDASKINYLPFAGGGEALAALLGGRVTAGISGWGEFEGQIKAGKLRAIAVSSPQRLQDNPTPTLREQGIPLEITNWRALLAGPGLSVEQRKVLSDVVEKTVKSPSWAEVLKQRSWDDAYLGGAAFEGFLKAETARVGDVLRGAGLVK